MNRRTWKPFVVAALLMSFCVTGCNRQQAGPPQGGPPSSGVPEVELAVVTVQREPVLLTSQLPGRTASYRIAEIRPQVNGLLEKRLFTEGSQVEAGDVLYQIDPAPYKAALDSAEANLGAMQQGADKARATLAATIAGLQRHQAILKLAKANCSRYERLLKTNAVSAMDHDQAVSAVDVAESSLKVAEKEVERDREAVETAEAAITQAEAALESAKINLGYTRITAPITGRIGRSHVTEGAIVTAYQPTPLATIQQLDPIYVDVPQSTTELIRLRRSLANGHVKNDGTDKVKIILEDGSANPKEGSLQFRDVTVDPTTGSVILRIEVPNPEFTLLPGMFVQAIIGEGVREQAILVPQEAVSRDQKGNQKGKPVVSILNAKNDIETRPITTDRALGNDWLVSAGLAPGDRVIAEGMQKYQLMRSRLPPELPVPIKVVPYKAGRTAEAEPQGAAQAAATAKPQAAQTPATAKPESAAQTTPAAMPEGTAQTAAPAKQQ